jgi:hypothetical protein
MILIIEQYMYTVYYIQYIQYPVKENNTWQNYNYFLLWGIAIAFGLKIIENANKCILCRREKVIELAL